MMVLRYRLRLEQPLLATIARGDPNSSVSYDYVPGSLMRGALIARYRDAYKGTDLAGETAARRLFFAGWARYLNAYPLDEDARRTLPTPRCLLQLKGSSPDSPLYNAAHPDWPYLLDERELADEQLEPAGVSFCAIDGGSIALHQPARSVAVHMQRDPVKGRAVREQDQVFQYDALAPNRWLAGVILLDRDDDLTILQTLLSQPTAWLGASASAEYAEVTIDGVTTEAATEWREVGGDCDDLPDLKAGDDLTLTLLSDAMLRDSDGAPVAAVSEDLLARTLHLPPGSVTIAAEGAFTSVIETGGYNATWRLPLTQAQALAAGSVIRFTTRAPLPAHHLRTLEWRGIGERRAEGFGRLAFDWLGSAEFVAVTGGAYQPLPATLPQLSPDTAAARAAAHLAGRLLEERLDRAILAFVDDQIIVRAGQLGRLPTPNQLNRLLRLVRQARPTADTATVRHQFGDYKPTARRQFDRARLEQDALGTWIERLLSHPATVWDRLPVERPDIAGQRPEPSARTDDGAAALRLLTAVLAALADQAGQEADG